MCSLEFNRTKSITEHGGEERSLGGEDFPKFCLRAAFGPWAVGCPPMLYYIARFPMNR